MKLITEMITMPIKRIFFQTHVDWGRNLYYVQKPGNVKTQKDEILPIFGNHETTHGYQVPYTRVGLCEWINESWRRMKIKIVDDLLHAIQT